MTWFDTLKANRRGHGRGGRRWNPRQTGEQMENRVTAGTKYTQLHEFLDVVFDLKLFDIIEPIKELPKGQVQSLSLMLGKKNPKFLDNMTEEQFATLQAQFNDGKIKEGLLVLIELAEAHKLKERKEYYSPERRREWYHKKLESLTPEELAERRRKKAEYDKTYRRPSRREKQ